MLRLFRLISSGHRPFYCLLLLQLMACAAGAGEGDETSVPIPDTCNGAEALCKRTYAEVAYATTHNGMSNQDDGWIAPNQIHGIERQLADGIRALMLDTYEEDGELLLCHGVCDFGKRGLVDALQAIETFLATNRGEVVTLLLQDAISDDQMLEAVADAGLRSQVYEHTLGEPWPTLRTMIDADKRLVMFAESGGTQSGPILHMWDAVWDTPYAHESTEAMAEDCTLNRGDRDNELFLINHWLYSIPDSTATDPVNRNPFLRDRVFTCWEETGHKPNFIAVNFYSLSDVTAVVYELNWLGP